MNIEISTAPVVQAADIEDDARFAIINDNTGQATTFQELKTAVSDFAATQIDIAKDYRLDVNKRRRGSVWPNKQIIQMFQSHTWQALAGGSHNLSATADPMYGPNYVELVSDGAANYKTFRKSGASGALPSPVNIQGKYLAIAFSVSDLDRLDALQIFLGDASLANNIKFNNLKGAQSNNWFKSGEKVVLTVSLADADVTGTPDLTNVEGVQIRFRDEGTGPVTLNLYGLWVFDAPQQALATVSWDDGYVEDYTEGFRYMSRYLMPATVYMIPEYMDSTTVTNRLSKAQLLEMQEKGWEIGGHHVGNNLKAFTEEQLHEMFKANIEWGREHGFENVSYAYPGGEFGPLDSDPSIMVEDIAQVYYQNARTISNTFHETLPVANPHRLRVRYITASQTVADVIADIDLAIANKEWIHIPFHTIVSGPATVSTEYNVDDFRAIIDHLANSGIEVVTVAEAMRRNVQ